MNGDRPSSGDSTMFNKMQQIRGILPAQSRAYADYKSLGPHSRRPGISLPLAN